jgi:hypothetical protein
VQPPPSIRSKLEQQAAEDRAATSSREHSLEMLMMDKAYLVKQVR